MVLQILADRVQSLLESHCKHVSMKVIHSGGYRCGIPGIPPVSTKKMLAGIAAI